jgi:hypothetical protein
MGVGTLQNRDRLPTISSTMTAEDQKPDAPESRRTLIIVVAVVAAVVIAGFFYLLMRAGAGGPVAPQTLQGAFRPGSPEFEQNKETIVLDTPEADESKRALGDIVMSLKTTVRNFTGKTLSGIEIRAAVLDYQGKPVRQRTVIVVPNYRQQELANNKTVSVQVTLEGMTDSDARANIKMEVTGFKFKE